MSHSPASPGPGPDSSPGIPPRVVAAGRRPILERLGLAAIALVLAALFGGVAAAAWVGGEPFLAVMGAVGCLMTVWAGVNTLLRG